MAKQQHPVVAALQKAAKGLVLSLSASQLYEEYRADPQEADRKYRGKLVRLSSVAAKIEKDGESRDCLGACFSPLQVENNSQAEFVSFSEAHRRLQEAALNAKYRP